MKNLCILPIDSGLALWYNGRPVYAGAGPKFLSRVMLHKFLLISLCILYIAIIPKCDIMFIEIKDTISSVNYLLNINSISVMRSFQVGFTEIKTYDGTRYLIATDFEDLKQKMQDDFIYGKF